MFFLLVHCTRFFTCISPIPNLINIYETLFVYTNSYMSDVAVDMVPPRRRLLPMALSFGSDRRYSALYLSNSYSEEKE